jgi:hypothetical protein
VEQLADQIKKRIDLDFLLCALEFCRSHVCSGTKLDFFDRINVTDGISPETELNTLCWKILKEEVEDLQRIYNAESVVAKKLSLLSVFKLPWKSSVNLLGRLCKDGGFSHEYSLEEALFVLHMCPQRSFSDTFCCIFTGKNDDGIVLYASCLAGAMAKVLKEEGKMGDFSFDINTSISTRKKLVIHNVKKLLTEYFKLEQTAEKATTKAGKKSEKEKTD